MLQCENLSLSIDNRKVLNNVCFKSEYNQITAIIGPSGGGKTTLLRSVARFIKPDCGQMLFDGNSLDNLHNGEIGFVFQAFNLFPHLTVLENLTIALTSKGLKRSASQMRAIEMLEKFDMGDKQNDYPGNLSGGQRQRVAIARTLMQEPKLLLFDEPTSALDPEMVKEVGKIIYDLKNDKRVIILITHEIRLARDIADHVLFLDKGEIIDNMQTHRFFNNKGDISPRAQKFLLNLS